MAERGKPVELLPSKEGQPIVRKAYGLAGKGCPRKRKPPCNEGDTGLKHDPTRK